MNDNQEKRIKELGEELRRIYNSAPKGMKMTAIQLFGIEHSEEIKELEYYSDRVRGDIYEIAGRNRNTTADLCHGVRIANFVEFKVKYPPWDE